MGLAILLIAGCTRGGDRVPTGTAGRPALVLADEPTATWIGQLHAEGRTVVLVTHDDEVAHTAGRRIRIEDGQIASDDG
ncbi:MAG: hypothetical protein ABMB14_10490 [Myxococcota bacterium]